MFTTARPTLRTATGVLRGARSYAESFASCDTHEPKPGTQANQPGTPIRW